MLRLTVSVAALLVTVPAGSCNDQMHLRPLKRQTEAMEDQGRAHGIS